MYFIVNKSKNVIVISDLGIRLGPRQGADLDSLVGREKAEQSKWLKHSIHKGQIEVKNKDNPYKEEINKQQAVNNPNSNVDIEKIKNDITNSVVEAISDKILQNNQPSKNEKIDVDKIADSIYKKMKEEGLSSSEISKNNVKEIIKEEEDEDIDGDILADIHSRSMDKLNKDIKSGDIKYEKEKSSNSLDDNISELEDLGL